MANIKEQEPPQENEQLPPINIQCLPAEVLTIIFRHLDVPGKGRVAQVCHYWRQVSRHKFVWHGVTAKAHLEGDDSFHKLIKTRLVAVLSPSTDRGQPAICLPHLTHMHFSVSESVKKMKNIPCIHFFSRKFPNLVSLSLNFYSLGYYCQFVDAAMGVICDNLKYVKHLYLTSMDISDEGIAILAGHNNAHEGYSQLETLELQSCKCLTDQSLLYISSLGQLQHLKLFRCRNIFSNEGLSLELISRLPRLVLLSVTYCLSMTGPACEHLARMESLRELNLGSEFGGDEDLAYLVDAGSQITSLQLYLRMVSRWSLLNQLTNLQSLTISYSGITDAALETLSTTSQIQKLNLDNCRNISDDALKHLAKMGSLRVVNLNSCKISDRGLGYLAQGKSGIVDLTIRSILVTNEGMKHLVGLKNLTALILLNCSEVSEKGLGYLGESAAQVTQVTLEENLREVQLSGECNFSYMLHHILSQLTWLRLSKLNRLHLFFYRWEIYIRDLIQLKLFQVDYVDRFHLIRKHYRYNEKQQH